MTNELVGDDEVILRHIPAGSTFQAPGPRITSKNFELRADIGETGVSVSRASLTPPDQLMARLGDPKKGSRIAAATAGEIRALGLDVVPDPKDYDPGHAEIRSESTELTSHPVRKQLA